MQDRLFLEKGRSIRIGNPPLRIEILTSIDGVEFIGCYKNRETVTISNVKVNFISLTDLKENKIASGRYQDLAYIENLERVHK